MRLSLRFILPLLLVLAGIAYAVAPLVDQLTLKWFVRDLEIRATLIANTVQEPLLEQLAAGKKAKIGAFFARITQSAGGGEASGDGAPSVASGNRLARTLSTRLPSRSTTSRRQSSHVAVSPVCGRRPSSHIMSPLKV
jgi:hypothetical protein